MYIFLLIIVFVLGAVVGSFLNVCIYRLPREESLVLPRSHCPSCNKTISWYDNIPFVSYLFLWGKCRYCKQKISFRYFIVEFINAFLYVVIFHYFFSYNLCFLLSYFTFASMLIVVTFIDFEYFIIPDEISIGGSIYGLILSFIFPQLMNTHSLWIGLYRSFFGGLVCGGALLLVALLASYILKKEAMGMGDVKLLTMIGIFLGWKLGLFTIFVASLLGSFVGVMLILFKGLKWQSKIPFGPYLSVGALITLLFGEKMITFYFSVLLNISQ